jgi:hypothetical protein
VSGETDGIFLVESETTKIFSARPVLLFCYFFFVDDEDDDTSLRRVTTTCIITLQAAAPATYPSP